MRIVHVMSWYVPGLGYQENILPRKQARLGHSVDIVASDIVPDSCRHIPYISEVEDGTFRRKSWVENGVAIHRLPCLKRGGQAFLIGFRDKLKELNPEVVQAHSVFSPVSMQSVMVNSNRLFKLFIDDHGLGLGTDHNLPEKAYMALTKVLLRIYDERVSCYLPVTYASEAALRKRLGIRNEKLTMLPLGADTSRFVKSSELRAQGRRELKVSDDEIVVVCAGKFNPMKRIELLIESFGLASRQIPGLKLVLVGSAPRDYTDFLRKVAAGEGLSNRVVFREFMPNSELPKIYNAADMGIWPGLPSITVIEAAATGLPIVVPENDVSYKLLTSESAVLTYANGDCSSLVDAITELAQNPSKRRRVGRAAESTVAGNLSWDRIARLSVELYEKY